MRAGATGSQKYRAIFGHFGSLPYFNITETTKRRLLNYPINRSTGCGSELGTRIHKKYIPLNAIAGWWCTVANPASTHVGPRHRISAFLLTSYVCRNNSNLSPHLVYAPEVGAAKMPDVITWCQFSGALPIWPNIGNT